MEYLKKFNSHSQYVAFAQSGIMPTVCFCVNEGDLHYNVDGLCFMATQANSTIKLNRVGTSTSLKTANLQYSIDRGNTWTNYIFTKQGNSGYSGETITLANVGDSVNFKGVNNTFSNGINDYHNFVMTGKISVEGDITSLLNNVGSDASMAGYCFYRMFRGCTALTKTPNLPSTELSDYCYHYLFVNCISLTEAPKLVATTMKTGCYSLMFAGCTGLTTAPELPATTLAENCYTSMFSSCTSLATAPELPSETMKRSCYGYMFAGCTALTAAPELPATNLERSCYNFMFNFCTSLTAAPELPATVLSGSSCYAGMFQGCSNLSYIKAMFTTTPSTSYTNNWVSGVNSTGTFVKNSSATWNVNGVHGVPNGWTVQTAST